ncbi:MAG: AsmA-like C-terminal region-containing protein [Campylobacter sp.]|nr:AsmA-like C-terminal region-containing protein [Campylobacter sp.]
MKIFTYFLSFILLLLLGAYIVLFTGFGNSLLSPYLQNLLSEKTALNIKINEFMLNTSDIKLNADINEEIGLNVEGKLSLFTQKMDLVYNVAAKNLSTFKIDLNEQIGLKGQVKGRFSDFDANGLGKAFDSDINFLANVKNYAPLSLVLNAKGLNLTKILALAKQPNFASGKLNLSANLKEVNATSQGLVSLDMNAVANNAVLKKEFNLTLPSNFTLKLTSDALVNGDNIVAKSEVLSPIATAKANKTSYNLADKKLHSDLNVNIANLAKLEPIIKQKLSGSLSVDANIGVQNGKITLLEALLKGLGGSVNANLDGENLNAKISGIKIDEILKLLAQPALANGVINGDAVLSGLKDGKDIAGKISLKTSGANLDPKGFKSLGLNMPNAVPIELNAKTEVKNSKAVLDASLLSSLLNLKNLKANYNLESKDADAKFSLEALDLNKFQSIVGAKLSGEVRLNADMAIKNNALSVLNLNGKGLGGDIKANLKGENLKLSLQNSSLKDLFLLIGQKPLANANINLDADFTSLDMKNLNAKANLDIKNGEFYADEMSKFLQKDFPKGVKFNSKSDINIQKSVANISSNLLTSLINLNDIKGKYNLNTSKADITLNAVINELSKLKFITSTPLYGKLELNAKMNKDGENLSATLTSPKLADGKLNASYKNSKLVANLAGFNFKGLSALLGFDYFYDGIGDAKLNYNTASKLGDFDIDIKEGRLVATKFTNTVKTFSGRDITTEIYKDGKIKGNIVKDDIDFNAKMSAQRSDINIQKGTLNTATSRINIPIDFRYEKTDAKISITGTTKEPKYSVSSEYIKGKITKEIDRFLDRKLNKNGGENSENDAKKDAVKSILKGLF